MSKLKIWIAAGGALFLFIAGIVLGYFIWGYYPKPETGPPIEWVISDQTRGETAADIEHYQRRIEELERENTELLIAIQSDWEAPETSVEYPAKVEAGELTWRWTERGGGYGLADFNENKAYMYFDPWVFPIDVEITREADGQLGATLSTTEEGLNLSDVRLYADYDKLFPEKKVGLRCGAGLTLPDTPVIMGGLEYKGWGCEYQYSGDHTVMITKGFYF